MNHPSAAGKDSAEENQQEAIPNGPPLPLLELRDGLPAIIDTDSALASIVANVSAGSGPVALDAERASGYRYSARAYLIQLRRQGAGSALIDPIAFADLTDLDTAIGGSEWILHAATQDLPCLREVGLVPKSLFDTELAARLLGYPRVGLATLVETLIGHTMRKEHSAVDWSERPLPSPWLEYAALDVEVLLELRDLLSAELEESGKLEWARQEFTHLLSFEPARREDPWRRTSGIHRIRNRHALAAVRALWNARDDLAQQLDCTPGRLIPDSALVAAATASPRSRGALMSTTGFHGRGARRYADVWLEAIASARTLADADLPGLTTRSSGPPQVRSWPDRNPEAAARLAAARIQVGELSERVNVPIENLLTPDYLRRVMWAPPATTGDVESAVAQALAELGARPWQVELMSPLLTQAIVSPES